MRQREVEVLAAGRREPERPRHPCRPRRSQGRRATSMIRRNYGRLALSTTEPPRRSPQVGHPDAWHNGLSSTPRRNNLSRQTVVEIGWPTLCCTTTPPVQCSRSAQEKCKSDHAWQHTEPVLADPTNLVHLTCAFAEHGLTSVETNQERLAPNPKSLHESDRSLQKPGPPTVVETAAALAKRKPNFARAHARCCSSRPSRSATTFGPVAPKQAHTKPTSPKHGLTPDKLRPDSVQVGRICADVHQPNYSRFVHIILAQGPR